ncbi:Helitron helicase [Phytophthora megakarya]|uniref:Helitron helicase n=1 Tax=Phytophthora megakarya TaxID=4795 RepID=A0A225WID4_9STRA|nr:Helitron helicase [Phytophthora megakarya]
MFSIESVENERERGTRVRVGPNEIIRYLNARYISHIEACIRLLDYVVQGKSHSIVLLPVAVTWFCFELTKTQKKFGSVPFNADAFLRVTCQRRPVNQIAETMLYHDIPKKFTWKNGRWVRRKTFQVAIGRMIHVSPHDMERFYLRLMLCNRRGPTAFENLRTASGIEYPSYLDAAKAAGHLENNVEWIGCMEEAREYNMPYQLFNSLLHF